MNLSSGKIVAVGAALALLWASGRFRRTPFDAAFARQAKPSVGITPNLLKAIALKESGMRPSIVSPVNRNGTRDYGLLQVNSATAQRMGVAVTALLDPETCIRVASQYLEAIRGELRPFTEARWVAAYNAGAPTINRAGIVNPGYVLEVLWNRQLFAMVS